MSSMFNFGPGHNTGLPITSAFADTRPAHDDVHDAELGRSTRYHTPLQPGFILKPHPEMVGKLPPVQDPRRMPEWDYCSTVDGRPGNIARKHALSAALLRDPVVRKSRPTKPKAATTMTPTRLCRHEASHGL